MDWCHAQLPGKVVLKSEGQHAEEREYYDVPESFGGEGGILHGGEGEKEHVHHIEKHEDKGVSDIMENVFPRRRDIRVLVS